MEIANIIKNWNSASIPTTRPYLIIDELIKYYNKMPYNNLVNLYNIDEAYKSFSWFIDKDKGIIYNVNLIIDGQNYESSEINNNILDELKCKSYMRLNFYINTLKRYQLFDKNKLSIVIHIYNNGNIPEYFKLEDVKLEEMRKPDIKLINIPESNKKRKVDEIEQVKKKRRVSFDLNKINWSEWISASSFRNFFLNDTIIDWLKEYNITSIHDIPKSKEGNSSGSVKYEIEDPFTKFIMEQGLFFEEKIMEVINNKYKTIKIAESYQARDEGLFIKTIDYMKKGIPIIYQGILHNHNNKTFGAPDLMIRNDFINKFIGYEVYNDKSESTKLNVPWHYVIVDIKHSTITLNSDGINIRNQDSIPAYKGQLLVYTEALNEIQGTNITKAFIMGKKYIYENKGKKFEINDVMKKLGVIDYAGFDAVYVPKLKEGIEWIRNVRKEGHTWKLLPLPSKEELYPNMKNDRDGAFGRIKKILADEISEITSVTYCGIDKRKNAFLQGIYGWNDPKCTSKILGFKEGNLSKRIDDILDINRQSEIKVKPEKIKYDEINWRNSKEEEMEFFLDYETLNSNFGSLSVNNTYEGINYIFMIGVGFKNSENNWEFKSFILEKKSNESEKKMLDDFWVYVNDKLKEYKKEKSVFFHWSQAEKIVYEKTQLRHLKLEDKKLIDLYKVFLNEPIVVKGALNYSLKTIVKALYKNDLVKISWDSSNPCSNGLNAMLLAYKCYEKSDRVTINIPIMKSIEQYNEIDCKSIYEVLEYLRKNH